MKMRQRLRTITMAIGGLLVIALAVWSDYQWRLLAAARREAATEVSNDPALGAEVLAAKQARQRLEAERAERGR